MARKPIEFQTHPVRFADALAAGLYRGVVKHVTDGDTVSVFVDAGFYSYQFVEVRIADVDTAEIVGEERAQGLAAKGFVESVALNAPCVMRTQLLTTGSGERKTFDRFVADVWLTFVPQFELPGTDSLAERIRAAGFDKLHPLVP